MDESRQETPARLLERRRLLRIGLPTLGGAAAAGLVLPLRRALRPPTLPAVVGTRRLTLAAAEPLLDPVLLAAREQGVFARSHLEIGFVAGVRSDEEALDRVQSGHADGAIAHALSWLPRLQDGLPARLVCGLWSGNARMLIARPARLHRIEDLFRHAIGMTSADTVDRLFFSIVMRRKGMHPDHDVAWRVMPHDALGLALAEGQVQAIIGHDPEVWQLRLSLHLDELASSRSGSYAVRVGPVLGLATASLRQDPGAARWLAQALLEAASWAGHHTSELGGLLAAQDPDLTANQAAQMLKAEGSNVHPIGADLRNQIAQYVDELKLLGIIPDAVDSNRFSRSFVADARKL